MIRIEIVDSRDELLLIFKPQFSELMWSSILIHEGQGLGDHVLNVAVRLKHNRRATTKGNSAERIILIGKAALLRDLDNHFDQ